MCAAGMRVQRRRRRRRQGRLSPGAVVVAATTVAVAAAAAVVVMGLVMEGGAVHAQEATLQQGQGEQMAEFAWNGADGAETAVTDELGAEEVDGQTEGSGELAPLFPLDSRGWLAVGLAGLGLMLAASGGIGGGGILVPVYIMVMLLPTKEGIACSNVTILGGSVTNTLLNLRKRHPVRDRPLVAYDILMVMEPLTIAGSLIGSFLAKVLPEVVLVIALVLLLGITAQRTLAKGKKLYTKETEQRERESELTQIKRAQDEGQEREGLLDETDEEGGDEEESAGGVNKGQEQGSGNAEGAAAASVNGRGGEDVTSDRVAQLARIVEEERSVPWREVFKLVALSVFVLFVNVGKGGGAYSPLGVECGSTAFWFLTASMLVAASILALHVRTRLMDEWRVKERVGYNYAEGDVRWNPRNSLLYPILCTGAGLAAGTLGVGGGVVKGPLMLEMGLDPQVSAATSAVMILFTSSVATASYAVFGLLSVDRGVFFFLLGLIATAVGQLYVGYLMKKYKRTSYIVLSIGAVVGLSAILMGIQSMFSIMEGGDGESSICESGE